MKIKELKHNHSLTDLLKVLLFSILMLAPILAIAVKCGYVMLNKNANQSYTNGEVIGKNEIANPSLLVENQDYIFNYKEYTTSNYDYLPYISYNSISIDWQDYTTTDTTGVVSFRMRTNDNLLQLKKTDNTTINLFNVWGQTLNTFTINYKSAEFTQTAPFYNLSVIGLIYQQNKLDNVFYYAIDEVAQEPLFNWTQNTAIYTGVNAMCTGMEITSPIIPILITYWFLLTCIYVIIDILIKGFTMLTHLIGSKLA